MESYKIITISHKTTHISKLKDYLLTDEDADFPASRLNELKSSLGLKELYYLNTCNRITFLFVNSEELGRDFLSKFLHFISPGFNPALLEMHLRAMQMYEGEEAILHMFRVAASVDSLIVGEREILRQIKDAYAKCKKYQLCGDDIRLLIEQAVVLSKKVCNETGLSERPVSVVSLAYREFAELVDHKDAEIVLIGAGQTNGLVANLLEKYGYKNVTVFNRSYEKAKVLADRFSGNAYCLSDIEKVPLRPEVIISCVASVEPVVNKRLMTHWGIDPVKPVTILDLGVPANVDIAVIAKYIVNYIHVAGLEKIAEENKAFRQKEMEKAEYLIADFMRTFDERYKERLVERAMSDIPHKVKVLRSRAFDVFKKDIDNLDPSAREMLDKMMDYMEQKYIGMPFKIAKQTLLKTKIREKI